MAEVSTTRLYLGNLPRNATRADIEAHFATHGTGEISEIKLMNGFGFIEYKDAMDARDVVPAFHGSDFMGERLTVQFARGTRKTREPGANGQDRTVPRPRRTPFRMTITGLPQDTSWQDLKDFARSSGVDVVYTETTRGSHGEGLVEFESAGDLKTAVEKLDNFEYKGQPVRCAPAAHPDSRGRSRDRSRSPGRRSYGYSSLDDHDRRPHPLGHSPPLRRESHRDEYRDRSPRRIFYEERGRYPRSPPRRPPIDDYPSPRPRYDDPYRRDYPPDPYLSRAYDRPPPPRDYLPRDLGYPRDGYARDYDRRY